MRLDVYKNTVYEFYNSVKLGMDAQNNIVNFTMKFRLHGKDHAITLEMLTQWLKYDCDKILNDPKNFNHFAAWIELKG